MKNEKNIRKFSAAELEKRRARHGTRSDLAQVRAISEAQLEKDITADEDFRGVPADWMKAAEAMMPSSKKLISLRIDEDVIDWFKDRGTGYQTRINAVLRAFVEQQVPRPGRGKSR